MTEQQPTYRGLIFDLDGTLIDSAPDIAAAVNDYFRANGWPEQETAFVERFIGNGPRRLLLDMMIELGLPHDDATVDAAVKSYIDNYNRAPTRFTRFYDNVREDIEALHAAGFELGICTNKPHALTLRVLDLLGIAGFFRSVVGADAVAACKPNPLHLFAVAERMDLPANSWAYVGDTTVDQATARAAEAPFFAVPWGTGRHLDVEPKHRLSRLLDLIQYRPVEIQGVR